jgi:hypothetical protein
MGFEQLLDGLELFIVAVGMIIVADTIVCLISPSLVLTSYGSCRGGGTPRLAPSERPSCVSLP